ncbi:MAG: CapA family protein [Candidatus Cloacimonetes bacterium]|nr:CapA family protein [Candidatus Cloacimonadota bacterium]
MKLYKSFVIFLFLFCSVHLFSTAREEIIENFESGSVNLISFPGEDLEPDAWELDTTNTASPESQYSLKLYGNTWKIEMITPVVVDSGDVWQVSAFIEDKGEIHGFGVMDDENVMIYSLDGTEELNIEEWVTVYQGAFDEGQWNIFQLPIAEDWFAWFDYLPEITGIIFVNDNDSGSGIVYFDDIINITEDLPIPPEVEISYNIGQIYRKQNGDRSVDVQFFGEVTDPDSDEHLFFWNFGDDSTSTVQDPFHTFTVEDDHEYTVFLEVVDDTDLWGQAVCQIEVDEGTTSFPLTMNFAGDIMLARGYEQYIIPNLGVEAIFEPTLSVLGNAADITVANLECPLTTHTTHHPTKGVYFKGNPENVAGLVFAGIDIVTLANNHIIDYMLEGMQETQSVLEEAGIVFSGAGADSYEAYLPVFYSRSGMNIAFLASCDRTGQYNNCQPYLNAGYNKPGFAYMTPYYVLQQIQAVEDYADLIVVNTHCGSEYSTAPGANYDSANIFAGWDEKDFAEDEDYTPRIDIPHMWDIEIRHHFIDSGADIVICHHPHVIQGLEIYNGKLIVHSLGNFAFDLNYFETFPSMILNTKINQNGFYEYSITPIYIDDYIPQQAEGELGIHLLDYIAMKSKEQNTYLYVDRDEISATVIIDTLTMLVNNEQYQQQLDFEQIDDHWVSEILHLPRIGNISCINSIFPQNEYEFRTGREIVWFGNFEDEGASMWNVNSDDEWLDDTVFYEGEYSLRQRRYPDSGDNIITNLENRIRRYSDGNYSLHGYIKTQNGEGVTIQARYYQNRTGATLLEIENVGLPVSGDIDWTYFQKELTLPDNTNYFDICSNSDCPANGEAFSWFDNVGLIEWTEWESITGFSAEITNPNDYYYLQIRSTDEVESVAIGFVETNYGNNPVEYNDDVVIQAPKAKLYQNYPNPFNPCTAIKFTTENTEKNTELIIYNLKGQKVKILDCINHVDTKATESLSHYSVIWNGTDENNKPVASGIYFYQLKINNKPVAAKKCLLLK